MPICRGGDTETRLDAADEFVLCQTSSDEQVLVNINLSCIDVRFFSEKTVEAGFTVMKLHSRGNATMTGAFHRE